MLATLASACLGGQSGGEVTEPDTAISELVPCECAVGAVGTAVHATLERVDACGIGATVDAIVARGERQDIAVGDSIVDGIDVCEVGTGLEAGDEVLLIYNLPAPPPPELAPDGGFPPSPAQVYAVPRDQAIRLAFTTEDLPSDTDDALAILLDLDRCKAFAETHKPPPPEGEGEGEGEGLEGPIMPSDPVMSSVNANNEEEQEAPDCGAP